MENSVVRHRRNKGLRQCELAVMAGVSLGHLCKIEKGWVTPCRHTAEKIAAVLEVTVNDLFPGAVLRCISELRRAS